MSGNLIIYFSRSGENYSDGHIVTLEKGYTEAAAEYIKDAVGADLFRIETVKDYPADYMDCTREAKAEQQSGARPELRNYLESLDGYENVFICGPCWWGTYPMAVFSQVERLDWKGRKVMALMTHEGSGLAGGLKDLKKLCRGASFGKGLAMAGHDVPSGGPVIAAWAKKQTGIR